MLVIAVDGRLIDSGALSLLDWRGTAAVGQALSYDIVRHDEVVDLLLQKLVLLVEQTNVCLEGFKLLE